ncbi:MAG: CvpA family protein [Kiritimatiellae bacterium]|nr:CvpA family protein [Kiritimatiellia bacterium]
MIEMLPMDWVLAGFVLSMAVMGLFRGFSGTLAFMAAIAVASVAGFKAWELAPNWLGPLWMCGAATLIVVLIVFGIVRLIVKKIVNGILAQPSDAVFGFVAGAVAGLVVIFVWAKTGLYTEYSNIVTEVAARVG